MKKLYVAVHSHREGLTWYPFVAERRPSKAAVVKAFDINYEPDRDTLEIAKQCPADKIPTME